MPLATKNNAIIVKDGKLAENCGCCGGWVCVRCGCSGAIPNKLRATFSMVTPYGSCSLNLTLLKASSSGTYPDDSCGFYSTGWGTSNQCRLVPGYDASITNNDIQTSYGTPRKMSGVLSIAFLPPCSTFNGTELASGVVINGAGDFPCANFFAWWLGTKTYNFGGGGTTPEPIVIPSFRSLASPCYTDFPAATSAVGIYDAAIYTGSVSLTVTGAE